MVWSVAFWLTLITIVVVTFVAATVVLPLCGMVAAMLQLFRVCKNKEP